MFTSRSSRNPLTVLPLRAARWSAIHPWRAIAAWLAFVTIAVACAMAVPTVATNDADYRVGESGRADAMVAEAGLDPASTESVLITAHPGEPLNEASMTGAAEELGVRMRSIEGVSGVSAPQWSEDRSAVLVGVELDQGVEEVGPLQEVTSAVQDGHPGLEVRQAGELSLDDSINDRVGEDLSAAEGTSVPVTLVLMLLAFGALIAAGIPVLLAASSVAATIGLIAPLSHLVHADATVSSMIVLIGMAVGVDYSLFYLKRERQERAAGRNTLDAVEIAAQTSGHSILVSGGAVIASMSGLFLIGDATFNSLAVGSILVVTIAVLGSITVLPALLVALGRWVDRPRVPLLWRLGRMVGIGGLSRTLLAPVLRHPVIALVVSGVVVALLAVPALGMKTHTATIETLPASIPEVQTIKAMTSSFPGQGTSVELVVKAAPARQGDVDRALTEVNGAAVATADFVGAASPELRVSADGETTVMDLAMPYEESDPRVDGAIEALRSDLAPPSLDGLDATYAVGGGPAESLDFSIQQAGKLPLVIGMVLLLTFLIMGLAFRSVPIAILSTVLNLASVGAAFGVLTMVFQHGLASGPLDFSNPGFVIDWIPLFVLVVLVGLSMDYHVFVLSRTQEHVRAGLPTRLAVERGIVDSAGVVTSAAAVMVSVFAIFASLSMMEMKMLGVGLSAAILIDATIIRLVMLPAAMVLLGDRAWSRRDLATPLGREVVEPEPVVEHPEPCRVLA